ncbi:MAG TPA: hypothetical protein PLV13_10985 [Ilumatobacteraceae bacterium]|nr:hypothetical protein [Ilumatobacteraceae bacterium]
MPASSGGWNLQPGEKDPTVKIIVGVVAVGALAIGVILATRGGDDDNGGTVKPPSTTVAIVTTTLPTSTTTPATTTSPLAPLDGHALVAAMPTADQTPAGWNRYREPVAELTGDEGSSFCDLPTDVERAQALNARAIAWGPGYDLPQGGSFAFDLFSFQTAADAAAFLQQLADDANTCTDTPVTYTESEADMDFLGESWGEDFDWNVEEASVATEVSADGAEALMRATVEQRYTTTLDGTLFTIRGTVMISFEQHGRLVIESWVYGHWDFTGLDPSYGQPDWAHQPVQSDLDDAVDAIREPMLSLLTTAGAV